MKIQEKGYAVKEIFFTLQGEGANMGRPAVFIRFAGCNLWSGIEAHRATAICRFCDTDFVGGKRYDAKTLAQSAIDLWPVHGINPFVVLTGGEPGLQVDGLLTRELKRHGFQIAIETNGTVEIPPIGIDWTCVSPKAGTKIRITVAEEIKLVFPQIGLMPEGLSGFQAFHHWLSPMDGPDVRQNTLDAIAYCKTHPDWRLAIQAHKFWDIR